jgi:transposase-like protein
MTFIAVQCPHGLSKPIVKRGNTRRGTPRDVCQHTACVPGRVLLDSCSRGCGPGVKHTILAMRLKARGIRDPTRVLRIRTDTGLRELRQPEAALESVNSALLRPLNPDEVTVDLERAGEAEREERWRVVGTQQEPRWLWQASAHATGAVLADVFGRRPDEVLRQ